MATRKPGARNAAAAELAALRRENQELRRRVGELGASSDQFLAVATHDLRTPLASLRLVAEMLALPGKVPPESARLVGVLARNVETMETLVADVLNASRLSQPGERLNPAEFELNALAEDILAGLYSVAVRKNVALDARLSPEAAVVRADRARVGQMLTNLVANALKFTPPGGAVVVASDGGKDWVEVSVSDTGPGLTAADKARLFQPFSRASAPPTGGEPSTGLGLYITRRIAEAHGGSVGAEGAPGKGSTFFFRLPRSAARKEKPC
jgi:signal transduction histidine kinase